MTTYFAQPRSTKQQNHDRIARPALDLSRLEDRVLFSATPLGDGGGQDWQDADGLDAGPGDGIHAGLTSAATLFALEAQDVEATNHAPIAHVDRTVAMMHEDTAFRWILPTQLFSDPDPDDTLQWSLAPNGGGTLPDWLTFDPVHHVLEGTPENDDVGLLPLQLTATDRHGASASIPFFMSIQNVDDLPTLELPDSLTGTVGEALHLTSINDANQLFADADGLEPGDNYRVELSLEHGRLELREFIDLPLYVEFTDSSSLKIETDSIAAIQTVLQRLEIHPDDHFAGETSLKLSVSGVDLDAPQSVARWTVADEIDIHFAAPVAPSDDLGLPASNGLLFLENTLRQSDHAGLRTNSADSWSWRGSLWLPDHLANATAGTSASPSLTNESLAVGHDVTPQTDAERHLELTASANFDAAHGMLADEMPAAEALSAEVAIRGLPVNVAGSDWLSLSDLSAGLADWEVTSDLNLANVSQWFRSTAAWRSPLGLATVSGHVSELALQYLQEMDASRTEWVRAVVLSPWALPVAIAAASGASAGYCAWSTKSGSLFVGALAVIPAWNCIDPLPVLERAADRTKRDRNDSLPALIHGNTVHAASDDSPEPSSSSEEP
ncbi:MAG: putative Ig domain-containing protein [Planctomycetales bacterium]|nr:putative Ig domain-containing protein [Planctomycetales bacterium]